ncbi:DUF484 family protein [Chitinivorax sp. B]|uniref:DUF484 family protein n=1 Tax=Chitinivorax sp. B TaxID=2502235 RepID=UPI00201724BE|nr:DUF484 family protein [Chitinivorax sp. B]
MSVDKMAEQTMEANAVVSYLKSHPEFFEIYADVLADIFIPHPHGGHAISITERQILTLREKSRLLEVKLAELLQFGEENDGISEKVHRLALTLLAARDATEAINGFVYNLLEDFSVPHVGLRVWGIDGADPAQSEFAPVSDSLKALAENLTEPYCGPHVLDEVQAWFGEASPRLRSFAQVQLVTDRTAGLLVLASEDPQRFYPEMGTLYLKRVGELLSAVLLRTIPLGKKVD